MFNINGPYEKRLLTPTFGEKLTGSANTHYNFCFIYKFTTCHKLQLVPMACMGACKQYL